MVQSDHHYEIPYRGTAPDEILGPDWRIDNYVRTAGGSGTSKWTQKGGPSYLTDRSFDFDGDGQTDVKRTDEPIYDLLLTHRKTDGVIWLRSIPIAHEMDQKELRVLAQRYVEASSGAGTVYVHFGEYGVSASAEVRYGTKLLHAMDCEVAGWPAHRVEFELSNVDRAQAGDAEAEERVGIVLIDPEFKRWVEATNSTAGAEYKVLLVAGYSNRPQDAAGTEADLSELLERIELPRSKSGGHTCMLSDKSVVSDGEEANLAEAQADDTDEGSPARTPGTPISDEKTTEHDDDSTDANANQADDLEPDASEPDAR